MKMMVISVILAMFVIPGSIIAIEETQLFHNEESKPIQETKDDVPPVSALHTTPSIIIMPENVYYLPTITVCWSGVDNPEGSGINHYDVEMKTKYIGSNPHAMVMPFWVDFQNNTTNTSADFHPNLDFVYYFRVRATDNFGNVEPWPAVADGISVVIGVSDDTYERIKEILVDELEERREHVGEVTEDIEDEIPERYLRENEDRTAPVSSVEQKFPLHIWMDEIFYPCGTDTVSIQVYPYPPSYYIMDWLEENDIITTGDHSVSLDMSWSGYDGMNGSGIKCYDVQYSDYIVEPYPCEPEPADGPWTDWIENTTETANTFCTNHQGLYSFRCRAYDNAGNVGRYPLDPDTSILVLDCRMLYKLID